MCVDIGEWWGRGGHCEFISQHSETLVLRVKLVHFNFTCKCYEKSQFEYVVHQLQFRDLAAMINGYTYNMT
jgi:hypothetical protein